MSENCKLQLIRIFSSVDDAGAEWMLLMNDKR